eukprot:352616-Chlamydomonas_euryale.AAC.18
MAAAPVRDANHGLANTLSMPAATAAAPPPLFARSPPPLPATPPSSARPPPLPVRSAVRSANHLELKALSTPSAYSSVCARSANHDDVKSPSRPSALASATSRPARCAKSRDAKSVLGVTMSRRPGRRTFPAMGAAKGWMCVCVWGGYPGSMWWGKRGIQGAGRRKGVGAEYLSTSKALKSFPKQYLSTSKALKSFPKRGGV